MIFIYKLEEKMEKYEDKKNNLLMSINGKTIFKIDNNFFIDNFYFLNINQFTYQNIVKFLL